MLQPSPDRAVRMYVEEAGDSASCRICGRSFSSREDAASHVKGLLAVNSLGDHCRIHGFDQPGQRPTRVTSFGSFGEDEQEDEGDAERGRRWSLLDLFSFRF